MTEANQANHAHGKKIYNQTTFNFNQTNTHEKVPHQPPPHRELPRKIMDEGVAIVELERPNPTDTSQTLDPYTRPSETHKGNPQAQIPR